MSNEIFIEGLIDKIQLVNYGRHSNLLLNNLSNHKIVQVTGSSTCGKSAIISAVLFAFGRQIDSYSAVGLIKTGKPFAEVAVTLRNTTRLGSFEREIFGDSITLRRKITRPCADLLPGADIIEDEFSICSSSRLVVYKTETALKRILQFFKIDIDNPLMAMTKEDVRAKLVPNERYNSKELYQMFLASIGLFGLKEEELRARDYLILCKSIAIEQKFKAMNPYHGIRFDHDNRALILDVRPSLNDSLPCEDDCVPVGISLMLALWQQCEVPVKFVDDLDALFDDDAERQRIVAMLEKVRDYYSPFSQLFIVSKKRVFSQPVCRDHQVLIVELRSARLQAAAAQGAAIEA